MKAILLMLLYLRYVILILLKKLYLDLMPLIGKKPWTLNMSLSFKMVHGNLLTYHLINLSYPPNGFFDANIIPMDLSRFKARFVARGFSQQEGLDYAETFSPVIKMKTLRLLLAFATLYDYHIHQMDVKTAFLNGILKEELYIS